MRLSDSHSDEYFLFKYLYEKFLTYCGSGSFHKSVSDGGFWPTLCSCLAMLSNESDSRKFLAPTNRRPLSSSSSRALKQQERSSSNRRTPWNCCNSEKSHTLNYKGMKPLGLFSITSDTLIRLHRLTTRKLLLVIARLATNVRECASCFSLWDMCIEVSVQRHWLSENVYNVWLMCKVCLSEFFPADYRLKPTAVSTPFQRLSTTTEIKGITIHTCAAAISPSRCIMYKDLSHNAKQSEKYFQEVFVMSHSEGL